VADDGECYRGPEGIAFVQRMRSGRWRWITLPSDPDVVHHEGEEPARFDAVAAARRALDVREKEPGPGLSTWIDLRVRPVSDPSETLALMAQHVHKLERLGTWGWQAFGDLRWSDSQMVVARGDGPTIGDAVRACVERIKSAGP
jgi:hypothetical protein